MSYIQISLFYELIKVKVKVHGSFVWWSYTIIYKVNFIPKITSVDWNKTNTRDITYRKMEILIICIYIMYFYTIALDHIMAMAGIKSKYRVSKSNL